MSLIGKGNITANGDSEITVNRGGSVRVALSGSFGGATVTMHTSDDGGTTFSPILDSAKTEADQYIAELTGDCQIKLVTSGGSSIDIDWSISSYQV